MVRRSDPLARRGVAAHQRDPGMEDRAVRLRWLRMSAFDAVDGSSTGIQVPHCGCC